MSQLIKLFLDDVRLPSEIWKNSLDPIYEKDFTWIIVRTYDVFVAFIEKTGIANIGFVSFDHDLDWHHYKIDNQQNIDYDSLKVKTGYHAAKWLIKYCQQQGCTLPEYKVHSMNPEGKRNIENLLNKFQRI